MSNYTEYVAAIYHRNPNARSETVERLASIARSLHRIDENDCNGYMNWRGDWDEAAKKRAEKRENRLYNEAMILAAELGAKLYRQGDPRGWPLYLYFPDDPGYSDPASDSGWHGVGIPSY